MARGEPSTPGAPGGFYNQRSGEWVPTMNMNDGRFPPHQPCHNAPHQRAQTIEAALKDCVGIPVKGFAVIAYLENGDVKTYSSPALKSAHETIFSEAFKSTFNHAVRRSSGEGGLAGFGQDVVYNDFEFDPGFDSRQNSGGPSLQHRHRQQRKSRFDESDGEFSGSSSRTKRRRYPGRFRDDSSEDTPIPAPVVRTQQLVIQDSKEVFAFYVTRFKDMQQSACKIMGKAFVKLVEPKKQTHYPYTRGDEAAPPWWPIRPGEEFYVRHKEPDHLLKPERIQLLVHILRMIVQPQSKQHPSVQKVGLTVKKLEEATNEAMSNWFGDRDHPENANKKPFLKEIFKVAKMEERWLNDEIDGTTNVPVMYGDRSNAEESEDECEEDGFKAEMDNEDASRNNSLPPNMLTPESIVSPSISHHPQMMTQEVEHRMRPIPHRYSTHPQPQISHPPIEYSQNQYVPESYAPRAIELSFSQNSSFHDRRTFSPQEYQASQQNMMWQPQQQQQQQQPSMVNYSPQTSLPPASAPLQLPPLSSHTMTPMSLSSYQHDGLPSRYESAPVPGGQFRTGSLSHPHQLHPSFENYLPENHNPYGHADPDPKDDHQNLQ